VAITGSVAVGKSTVARTLASLLPRWKVDIVATDGFLFPNAELEARGLMQRKGSYNLG
jgi:type I pantothenate kinase